MTPWSNAAKTDKHERGRFTRAYVRASLGMTPLTDEGFDSFCSSITTALLSFPERLAPIQQQGERTQADIERDASTRPCHHHPPGGRWPLAFGKLQSHALRPALKQRVAARLIQWTQEGRTMSNNDELKPQGPARHRIPEGHPHQGGGCAALPWATRRHAMCRTGSMAQSPRST